MAAISNRVPPLPKDPHEVAVPQPRIVNTKPAPVKISAEKPLPNAHAVPLKSVADKVDTRPIAQVEKPNAASAAHGQHPHSNLGAYLHPAKNKSAKPVQPANSPKAEKAQVPEAPPNRGPVSVGEQAPLSWSGGTPGQWGL